MELVTHAINENQTSDINFVPRQMVVMYSCIPENIFHSKSE